MEVERFGSEHPLPLELPQLLSADQTTSEPETGTITLTVTLDSVHNRCTGLTVQTPDGAFSATDDISFSQRTSLAADRPARSRTIGWGRMLPDPQGDASPLRWQVPAQEAQGLVQGRHT